MKKLVSVLLTMVLVFSTTTGAFASKTNTNQEIKTVIDNYFTAQFDSIKNGDETSFINLKDNFDFNIDNSKTMYDYELGRLQYDIASDKSTQHVINDYQLNIDYTSTNINGNNAIIDVNVGYTIVDNWTPEGFWTSKNHQITLKNNNGKWFIINDAYSDEFKDLYPIGTNFDTLIANVNEYNIKNDFVGSPDIEDFADENLVQPNIVPGDYYDYYDANAAVTYALTYTSEGTEMTGTGYNDIQFNYYSQNKDCQNYVSQCIWAGFGGTSTTTIQYPMNSTYWWANHTSYVNNGNWLSASTFLSYATNNAANNLYFRVQCTATNAFSGNTFVAYVKKGDYIYVPGHVLFVTSVNDINGNGKIDYNEILVSAHTYNHKNYPLYQIYKPSSAPSIGMQVVNVSKIRCNDGTSF